MTEGPINTKSAVRRRLRDLLDVMAPEQRHAKSLAACAMVSGSPEFDAARCVIVYVSIPT